MKKYTLEEFARKLIDFTDNVTERKWITWILITLVSGSRIYKIDKLYLCDMINCLNSIEIEIEHTKDWVVCRTFDDAFLIVKE